MNIKKFIQKQPGTCYFITTFTISWLGAFILVAPKLFLKGSIPKSDGIFMFPLMIIGPVAASIILTSIAEGKTGLRYLVARMGKWKVPAKWYFISFIIPPVLIIAVLVILKNFVSQVFTPNFFPLGFLFGIPAGFLEEIGWMGYAFPKMQLKYSFTKASLLLGLIWGLWHLPVIDFLGAAGPHGQYLLAFTVSFIASMAAIRMLITFIYSRTNSILLAQLMHLVSTGSLVIFGPSKVSAAQETLWYALYAVLLWIIVLVVITFNKKAMPLKAAKSESMMLRAE